MVIFPKKLQTGDEIRVIAPSKSISFIKSHIIENTINFFNKKGFQISLGKNIYKVDEFNSSPIIDRIEDIHDAFTDKNVKAIFSAIGGASANQLLKFLNFTLIKKNPKIFCGLSDITTLSNAIYTKTGMITYSGPHATLMGAEHCVNYTWKYIEKCLIKDAPFIVNESK